MTLQLSKRPLNLENLLRARTDESDRIEYKAGWNRAHDDLTETELKILWFLRDEPQGRAAIAEYLGLKSRSGHLYRSIDHLRGVGLIELTIPDKPQSRHQKMRITNEGTRWLNHHVISKKHPQLK